MHNIWLLSPAMRTATRAHFNRSSLMGALLENADDAASGALSSYFEEHFLNDEALMVLSERGRTIRAR